MKPSSSIIFLTRSIKIKPNKWLFNVNVSKSLFKGAEVSFYVNNFLDDAAVQDVLDVIQHRCARKPEILLLHTE
jgi:hypothetical protein